MVLNIEHKAEQRKPGDRMPTMLARRNSSIHRVREVPLPKVDLHVDYDVIRLVGEGAYGQVHLSLHRKTQEVVALKSVPSEHTRLSEFRREFHYSYYLSPHQNILKSYDVAFEAEGRYWFAQEYCPYGDLAGYLRECSGGGMEEEAIKLVARQITSALEFMHSKDLVHRDVKLHNVLVFEKDLSRVKLTDFGLTRKVGTLVRKNNVDLPLMPPEICEAVFNEGYHVDTTSDVWQLTMMIVSCLTGSLPWQQADITDSNYTEFLCWQKRKTTKTPHKFRNFSERFLRMLRRMLDYKPSNRPSVTEVYKYMEDRWVKKLSFSIRRTTTSSSGFSERRVNKETDVISNEQLGELAVHETKHVRFNLGDLLVNLGINTDVDGEVKRKRVQEWILTSL